MKLPSIEHLNYLFSYSQESGDLIYKVKRKRKNAGDTAGCVAKSEKAGYIQISIDGQRYYAHRIIYKIMTGMEPEVIDHQDGNVVNNSWVNLANGNETDNARNKRLNKNNKSGVTGVSTRYGKYRAEIWHDGKQNYLGSFAVFFDAVCARKSAENKFGFHINHGKIKGT